MTTTMSGHDAVEVIRTKRDRAVLSDSQIDWVVDAYTRGEVADEQMAALAMAILLNGMDRREIARWTAAMIASGERMDFSASSRPDGGQALHRRRRRQDHPAAGAARGGLRRSPCRSCPAAGWATPAARWTSWSPSRLARGLSNDEMMAQLQRRRRGHLRRGRGLAPADKKLYALRDVTGTVEAIPLIASRS